MDWIRERSLTLSMLGLFLIFLVGQLVSGFYDYNGTRVEHGEAAVSAWAYGSTGHLWEATFENWESEFLQMAVFIVFTTRLIQKGSPESRRPGAVELVDVDPRDFRTFPNVPWPVRRGGWVLKIYERSLGLAFLLLFLGAWAGHALGGFRDMAEEHAAHGQSAGTFTEYLLSSRFWFESFQNWQSEFLSIAAMVWLAVYLRQKGSPESKPVHAPHDETGR